jgi:hypothetical protein
VATVLPSETIVIAENGLNPSPFAVTAVSTGQSKETATRQMGIATELTATLPALSIALNWTAPVALSVEKRERNILIV